MQAFGNPARAGAEMNLARPSATSAVSFKSDSMPLHRIPGTDPSGPTSKGDCHDQRFFHHLLPLHRLPGRSLPMRLQRPVGAVDRARSRADVRLPTRLWLRLRR
jgi:hypothetical protein